MADILAIPAGDALGALLAATALGATSSAHCFLMCGPLACAAGAGRRPVEAAGYHGARVISYAILGAAAGVLGGGVAAALAVSVRPALPWVMAAVLVAGAFGFVKRVGALPGLSRVTAGIARRSAALPPSLRAGAIGALTPLLPCGLLYGVLAAALTAGSLPGGAAVMGGFALGATPALLLAQVPGGVLRRDGRFGWVLTRALPLAAAAVLVVRALVEGTGGGTCH